MDQETRGETTGSEETGSETAASPLMLADPDAATVRPDEFGALAAQMATAYRRSVEFYKNEYGKALPEALEMAAKASTDSLQDAFIEGLRADPPEQVTWWGLRNLEDACPGDSLRKWEEVKAWAKDELTSGMRGAAAVENMTGTGSSPLSRARYSVLVQEMAKDWQPLTGIEYLLVEQMAQAYTMQIYWTGVLGYREAYNVGGKVDHERGTWETPTVTRQQALGDAAAMVDRWNRMFLRCLRQLRDLRRYSPVVIQNAGQVNVGGQQVNVSEQAGAREGGRRGADTARKQTRAKRSRRPAKKPF